MNRIPLAKQLSASYRKQNIVPNKLQAFEEQIQNLMFQLNEHLQTKASREENIKLHIVNFLQKTFYPQEQYLIQPLGDIDLALFRSNSMASPIGVLLEIKQPDNKQEFPQAQQLNNKALQQLLYYYLQQRHTQKNNNLKYLILSNGFEWYVFSAEHFRNLFYEDKALIKEFIAFEQGQKDSKKTKLFYKEIAAPSIDKHLHQLQYSYFDLRQSESFQSLETLYKFFSPAQLLAEVQYQDQNQLNKDFYLELLYIIGLEEVSEQGRKLIKRCAPERRQMASLLEMSLDLLLEQDLVKRWPQALDQEEIFSLALELCLTWVNRILFLKLLESQLSSYHPEEKAFRFLNSEMIPDFNRLDALFFGVLAKEYNQRSPQNQARFGRLPYLNSSLFEPSEYEQKLMRVSNLPQEELQVYAQTVLKDHQFERLKTSLPSLDYLFRFLDAYDFGSDNHNPDRPKTLISASVLGLIFEKINGYRDGSFYTPAYVTMYMSRQTIRRAVIKHFNKYYDWHLQDFESLRQELRQEFRQNPEQRLKAAEYFQQLRICDPAVGSGHFLVSALNELLLIKQELGLLLDQNNKVLPLELSIEQDELVVEHQDTGLFYQYQPKNTKTAYYQQTLFHQKQSLIENCLFGIDLNPNSVKICRLRLWIELLKNTYYKTDGQLQTLPNIDINIKIGNSLISQYLLNQDLSKSLNKKGFQQKDYQQAVQGYRQAQNKDQKAGLSKMISQLKTHIVQTLRAESKEYRLLQQKKSEYYYKYEATTLDLLQTEEAEIKPEEQALALEKIKALEDKIKAQENPELFGLAFEWRFEFPEILDAQGQFIGFDIILGNPPYIRQEQIDSKHKAYFKQYYETYHGKADLYVYFVERALQLLKPQGQFSFILPNKWLQAGYGLHLRNFIKKHSIEEILDFDDLPVFTEASTYPLILSLSKTPPKAGQTFPVQKIRDLNFQDFSQHLAQGFHYLSYENLAQEQSWNLGQPKLQNLISKIQAQHPKLETIAQGRLFRGVTTGCNQAFVIDAETYQRLIKADVRNAEVLKPLLAGRDVKRYEVPKADKYLIYTPKGFDIEAYPDIKNHLLQFKTVLEKKSGANAWYELQGAKSPFENSKLSEIVFAELSKNGDFTLNPQGVKTLDTTFIIAIEEENVWPLLAILNSKVILFIMQCLSSSVRGGYMRWKKIYTKQLPIPIVSEDLSLRLGGLAREIMEARLAGLATEGLERAVDVLVYELYGLDLVEVGILEASLGD